MTRKNEKTNLKLVDQQHKEAVRREEELESCNLTPAEITARVREIRSHLEYFRDALSGVPFDIVAEEPGGSIRNSNHLESVSELAERLNPFLKGWRVHCAESLLADAQDKFGWLTAGLADTGFAIGVLAGFMFHGASEAEIDRLERGFIHANARRWWYREGSGK